MRRQRQGSREGEAMDGWKEGRKETGNSVATAGEEIATEGWMEHSVSLSVLLFF